jgi:methylase of polypeptide subunit release factors
MENNQEKKYFCGNGKYIANRKGVSLSINLSKIPVEYIITSKKGEKWVRLTEWFNDSQDQYGNDTRILVDNFKPKKKEEGNGNYNAVNIDTGNGLPF